MDSLTRRVVGQQHRAEVLRATDAWFSERGIGLVISEEDGAFWAALMSRASLQVFAPRYGHGDTPEAEASSAQERYVEEECPNGTSSASGRPA